MKRLLCSWMLALTIATPIAGKLDLSNAGRSSSSSQTQPAASIDIPTNVRQFLVRITDYAKSAKQLNLDEALSYTREGVEISSALKNAASEFNKVIQTYVHSKAAQDLLIAAYDSTYQAIRNGVKYYGNMYSSYRDLVQKNRYLGNKDLNKTINELERAFIENQLTIKKQSTQLIQYIQDLLTKGTPPTQRHPTDRQSQGRTASHDGIASFQQVIENAQLAIALSLDTPIAYIQQITAIDSALTRLTTDFDHAVKQYIRPKAQQQQLITAYEAMQQAITHAKTFFANTYDNYLTLKLSTPKTKLAYAAEEQEFKSNQNNVSEKAEKLIQLIHRLLAQ